MTKKSRDMVLSLLFLLKHVILASRGAGPTPKGGPPMSITEIIALLMLVIAAISLGASLKK